MQTPTGASIPAGLDVVLLPGTRELLSRHARELPQRDDLCGAFCGALALCAAGIDGGAEGQIDQDAFALAAGSVVSALADTDSLPFQEKGRRDYRLALPLIDDPSRSGTTAAGVVRALEQLSAARLVAIPYMGPWTPDTLDRLFDLAAALSRPVTLVANLATHHLWGSRARVDQLLDYLLTGEQEGPAPDWDVGHFACVVGRLRGPRGCLYAVADTYPSLGSGGVHLQPAERLAVALERRDMPAGGVIAVVFAEDGAAVRSGAGALGLREGLWDNGTATMETPP
ncbi:MAG: hypothetical protein ABSG95_06370 [Solirubrobacteraceae bacterium]|jgi:hypothetical protein